MDNIYECILPHVLRASYDKYTSISEIKEAMMDLNLSPP